MRSTNNLSWFFLVSIKCWFQCVNLNLEVRKVQIILLFQSLLLCAASRTVACQAPLSKGFFRQEYWSGLPFPPPWDHPDPGITPGLFCLQHCRQIIYHCATWEEVQFIQPRDTSGQGRCSWLILKTHRKLWLLQQIQTEKVEDGGKKKTRAWKFPPHWASHGPCALAPRVPTKCNG